MPAPMIYYVRHALTDWNVQQRLQGRKDVPLNEQGIAQSVRCGEILRRLMLRAQRVPESFDYVSSPLVRARRTMELMLAVLGLQQERYRTDASLSEIAFGEWEGLTYDQVLARDHEVIARRESDKWGFSPPGGESYAQVAVRIGEWYAQLKADTVVCAHGGTARALIAHLALASTEDATHYSVAQGAVYVFADNTVTCHDEVVSGFDRRDRGG